MVQRKAPNKLGIQADSKNYDKSDKWSLALKPSSQHQDVQEKGGTELKIKEMKKSRSIKLLDLQDLEPPPTRRPKSRFNKPATNPSTAAAAPQRPSMINKRDPSPNYMKPTSSSDAKKECSQVSPRGDLASCLRKSLSPSPTGRNSHCKSPSPSPSGRNSSRMSLSPCPNGRASNRKSPSPGPSGRNSHGTSLSPSPSARNSSRMNLSPCLNGRTSNCKSLSPSPSGRNSHGTIRSPSPSGRNSNRKSTSPSSSGRNSSRMSLSPCPNGRTSDQKSPSPCPSGRKSHGTNLSPGPNGRDSYRKSRGLSPSPSGRNTHGTSLSPSPSGRNSYRKSPSPCPSGRNSHCKSPSPCPSGRNSNRMSPSPNPSGRNSDQKSPSSSPSGRDSHSLGLSPSLRGRHSNTKPSSASGHKPAVKTSTKTPSLKPVRTLTKTPSLKGGAELKKQIKKSRSIKLLGLESLESSPMEQTKSGFDESPGIASSGAVTSRKQSPIKTLDLLPNYMKPTSSSDSRKEHSQESTQGSQTSTRKSPNESNLIQIKPSSASSHKPARSLTKSSRLKPIRTLTKTSSLKLPRPSMKNRPDMAPCSSLNAGKATCSSTLKDSKFPSFLTLSPGATESEGTSAMKVCPYTYCSLNGHHHAPLPPLKHFLSARRHLLKTQKSQRMKNLSPLQKKPPGERRREIDAYRVAFNDDPTAQAEDLAPSAMSPMIKDDGMDFFLEIYAKLREDTATSIRRSIQDGDDEATTDCSVNSNTLDGITSSVIYGTEIETENDAEKVHESMPDELSYSEMSLEDNTDQDSNLVAEMDIPTSQHDQFIQVEYTDYQSCLAAETGTECCIGQELEGESAADTELEESSLEATDMDWEEGQFAATPSDNESDLMTMHLPEFKSPASQEELVFKPDDIVNKDAEFPAEGLVQQQVHTENAESLNMEYYGGDDDSETDTEDQSSGTDISINVSGKSDTLFSTTEVAFKEPATIMEEKDGVPEPDETFNSTVYSASVEDSWDEHIASSNEKTDEEHEPENFLQDHQLLGVDELIPVTDVKDGALVNEQESGFLAFSNNIVGVDVGGNAERKEQAEDAVEHDDHGLKSSHAENSIGEEETLQVEDDKESDTTEAIHSEDNIRSSKKGEKIVDRGNDSNQQTPMTSVNLKRTIRCRRSIEEQEEQRKFNPREPRFLDIEPEPEPEKVDLRHQMMDERKNADEWMLDHALQQAVTKLAPARKRRVALLVEAFETVIPPPKYETHRPNTSAAFAHARRIQACN